MGLEKTLGGQRLGAGQKRTEELPEYGRSSFNQSGHFRSTMAAGILYPCFRKFLDMNETIDIDIEQDIRTLPTKGPLFGSFKTQVDLFEVPWRLYQGILHNNPVNLGMKMNQVYLPKLILNYKKSAPRIMSSDDNDWQINNSSLMKYLGLSGIGAPVWDTNPQQTEIERKINAIPLLGYYDIFKNYYANKQEENAYVITPKEITEEEEWLKADFIAISYKCENGYTANLGKLENNNIFELTEAVFEMPSGYEEWESEQAIKYVWFELVINKSPEEIEKGENGQPWTDFIKIQASQGITEDWITLTDIIDNYPTTETNIKQWSVVSGGTLMSIKIPLAFFTTNENAYAGIKSVKRNQTTGEIELSPFALENIDKMRNFILSSNELGYEFTIGINGDWDVGSVTEDGLPYAAVFKHTESDINYSSFAQSGLIVKTYQNDLFNNWIQTDWIEGENGIAELSKVSVSDGAF